MNADMTEKAMELADAIIAIAEKFGCAPPELLTSEIGAEHLYRIELCLARLREILGHSEGKHMSGRILEIGDLEGGTGALVELSKEDTLALAHGGHLYGAAEIIVRTTP